MERDRKLEIIERRLQANLKEIRGLLPPKYKLTLFARNPEVDGAHIIVTDDELEPISKIMAKEGKGK